MRVYINGAIAGTPTASPKSIVATTTDLHWGANSAGGNTALGVMDEIAIYNVALSAATIEAHYAAATSSFGGGSGTGPAQSVRTRFRRKSGVT
jgi:hypothetical protein